MPERRSRVARGLLPALVVLVLVALLPEVGEAQRGRGGAPAPATPSQGRVFGAVFDSLHARPLAGAFVWVEGTTRSTTTDERGVFDITDVPSGEQVLAVAHPMLDSLGIPELRRGLQVLADEAIGVGIAVPSFGRLWDQLCDSTNTFDSGGGIIFGTVRDPGSRALIAGAAVVAEWYIVAPDESGRLAAQIASAIVASDAEGMYRMCGIPPATPVSLQGHVREATSEEVELHLGVPPLARRELLIPLPARR